MRGRSSRWIIPLTAFISLHASGAWAESVESVTLRGVVIRLGDFKRKIVDAIGSDFLVGEEKNETDFRVQREYYRVDGKSITFDYKYPLTITSITVDDATVRTHTERPLCAPSTSAAGSPGHRASGWYHYRGRLAGQPVSLYLRVTNDDRMTGVYEYEKVHRPIQVIAYISQTGREIDIDELDEEGRTRASFWGHFRPWKPWGSPNLSCDWIVGVWRRTGTSETDPLHEGAAFQAFDLSLRSIGLGPPKKFLSRD